MFLQYIYTDLDLHLKSATLTLHPYQTCHADTKTYHTNTTNTSICCHRDTIPTNEICYTNTLTKLATLIPYSEAKLATDTIPTPKLATDTILTPKTCHKDIKTQHRKRPATLTLHQNKTCCTNTPHLNETGHTATLDSPTPKLNTRSRCWHPKQMQSTWNNTSSCCSKVTDYTYTKNLHYGSNVIPTPNIYTMAQHEYLLQ